MEIDEAIYCLNAESECCQELCDECPLYGQVGTDHCYEDALHMAIESLKFKKEYQARVQKCFERIDGYIEATYYNSVSGSISDGNKNAAYHNCKNIIKEEMGVVE